MPLLANCDSKAYKMHVNVCISSFCIFFILTDQYLSWYVVPFDNIIFSTNCFKFWKPSIRRIAHHSLKTITFFTLLKKITTSIVNFNKIFRFSIFKFKIKIKIWSYTSRKNKPYKLITLTKYFIAINIHFTTRKISNELLCYSIEERKFARQICIVWYFCSSKTIDWTVNVFIPARNELREKVSLFTQCTCPHLV